MKKVKRFLYRLKRLLDWLPVIWNDRDFDYAFLLEIIQYKLRKMQEWFESDKPNVESAPQTAMEIKEVLVCLDRYFNETYRKVEYTEFDIKHNLNNEDDFWTWHETFNGLPESARQEWLDIGKQAETDKYNDLMQAFNLLKQNIEGWWD